MWWAVIYFLVMPISLLLTALSSSSKLCMFGDKRSLCQPLIKCVPSELADGVISLLFELVLFITFLSKQVWRPFPEGEPPKLYSASG